MKKKPEIQARFMQIKIDLLNKIESGQMITGDKVPSENQLSEAFSVSRMTARRALSELVTEGVLVRSQGIGTFVADSSSVVPVLELPNIDDQISQQQAEYSNDILSLSTVKANLQQSSWLGVAEGAQLFNLKVVHKKDGIAIQLEDVVVNPALVPEFDQQDFENVNSVHYLDQVAPFTNIQHSVEAILPNSKLAAVLEIADNQACIKVSRKISSNKGVVSFARLYHAGNRFQFGNLLEE